MIDSFSAEWNPVSSMATHSLVFGPVLDLHRCRETVPHMQATDYTVVNGPHILEELDDVALQFELVWHHSRLRRFFRPELDTPDGCGPRVYEFSLANPNELEAAETELLHGLQETTL